MGINTGLNNQKALHSIFNRTNFWTLFWFSFLTMFSFALGEHYLRHAKPIVKNILIRLYFIIWVLIALQISYPTLTDTKKQNILDFRGNKKQYLLKYTYNKVSFGSMLKSILITIKNNFIMIVIILIVQTLIIGVLGSVQKNLHNLTKSNNIMFIIQHLFKTEQPTKLQNQQDLLNVAKYFVSASIKQINKEYFSINFTQTFGYYGIYVFNRIFSNFLIYFNLVWLGQYQRRKYLALKDKKSVQKLNNAQIQSISQFFSKFTNLECLSAQLRLSIRFAWILIFYYIEPFLVLIFMPYFFISKAYMYRKICQPILNENENKPVSQGEKVKQNKNINKIINHLTKQSEQQSNNSYCSQQASNKSDSQYLSEENSVSPIKFNLLNQEAEHEKLQKLLGSKLLSKLKQILKKNLQKQQTEIKAK